MKGIWILLVTGFLPVLGVSQPDPLITPDSAAQTAWVEARYNAMTPEDRIGQLFMVLVSSAQGKAAQEQATGWIRDYGIGGVVFSTGGPVRQAQMTNAFQQASRTPLLIAMDAEWGLAMRLDSTYAFPWNSTLGAIRDSTLLVEIGQQIQMLTQLAQGYQHRAFDVVDTPRPPESITNHEQRQS